MRRSVGSAESTEGDARRLDAAATPPGNAPAPTPGRGRSPLWAVVAITWLGSLSTGAAISGIYFVTERQFGYGDAMNLTLAMVVGIAYVAAAVTAGPLFARLRGRLTQRTVLAGLVTLLGLACFVPAAWPTPPVVWAFCIVNSTLSGWFWPLVESYVSGGRRGAGLRRATGAFNVSWASAVAVSLWLMQPLLARDPMSVLFALGWVWLAALLLLPMLGRDPGGHGDAAHPHTAAELAQYRRLLAMCRYLLVLSYLLMSIVTPMLPTMIRDVGVPQGWRTVFASLWPVSRVLTFALLQSTHRWHGSRRAPLCFGAVLLVGCVLCMVGRSPVTLGAALVIFGAGLGAVYGAAIYYALEVGSTEVDAGGRHEAMIGIGYAGGPLVGLIALGVALLAPDLSMQALLVGVVLLSSGLLGMPAWRAGRA